MDVCAISDLTRTPVSSVPSLQALCVRKMTESFQWQPQFLHLKVRSGCTIAETPRHGFCTCLAGAFAQRSFCAHSGDPELHFESRTDGIAKTYSNSAIASCLFPRFRDRHVPRWQNIEEQNPRNPRLASGDGKAQVRGKRQHATVYEAHVRPSLRLYQTACIMQALDQLEDIALSTLAR